MVTDADALIEVLNRRFGDWKPARGDALAVDVKAAAVPPPDPRIIIFDVPGAPQSNIVAARVIDPPYEDGYTAFDLANMMYGGVLAVGLIVLLLV